MRKKRRQGESVTNLAVKGMDILKALPQRVFLYLSPRLKPEEKIFRWGMARQKLFRDFLIWQPALIP